MSSNPSVQRIVVESTSALPIQSVASVQRYTEGLPRVCAYTLRELLDDAERSDAAVDTNKLDRCICAHLRFQCHNLCAELFAVDDFENSQNVRDLIVANLRTPPYHQSLRLQPLVWGRLLSKILPFDHKVYELLFHALPTIYWHANFKCPPHFFPNAGLPILMTPTGDHLQTLFKAISKSLFMSIGNILLKGCDDFEDQDSVSYHDSTSQLSDPDDSRVQLLLSMAGSSSIHRMNALDSSPETFFRAVLLGIMAYMGVKSDIINQPKGSMSPVPLDNNRSTVLRLLYMLVSSEEYHVGNDSMCIKDQCLTLIIFFRVLNCTYPHPEYNFSAELTAKFVSIAFQDDAWLSGPEMGRFSIGEAAELVIHLFEHSFTMNVAFAHFVDKQLFGSFSISRSSDWDLSTIIGTFVARLSSGELDPLIQQRSLDYLHEHGSLHTACTVLIVNNNITALRQLTLLHCNDPVWPQCLQSLQEEEHHLQQLFGYPKEWITWCIADLKADIEQNWIKLATGVHSSGMTHDMRPVQEDNEQIKSAWSKVKVLPPLLHWVRQHHTREALSEEVELV
ncbi:uncharacterized protein EV420DRAFT_1644294 [Desarmillaria tabescens]|uniref:Uncharacterized protein n=1 Tax=Armillaria tabescens TaxID=1929756 RepID=A0AA39K9N6_ARMTA|nr:uncharacterized protein EV420DRAFT_1644294 [Desarmillaria tabescens]KAK0457139.1 hypothetical protein EV420DRAFT_1644294 [Desarmillaria tabescens]